MPITTEFEYSIQASRDFIFDWFSDLSPDDVKLAKPLKQRKIISRSPTEARLEDTEVILGKRINLDVQVFYNRSDYSWSGIYTSGIADARSEYRLLIGGFSVGTTTTILKYRSTIFPKGLFTKLISPIIGFAVKRTFEKEFEAFKKAIEHDHAEEQARRQQQQSS